MVLPLSLEGASAPFSLDMCAPGRRDDALLARSLAAFTQGYLADALLDVECVCRRLPRHAAPALLRAKILQNAQPALALKAWYLAWCRNPQDALLQDAMLQAFITAGALASVRDVGALFLPARCRSGQHAVLVQLLRSAGAMPIGACWKVERHIEGMVFFPEAHNKGTVGAQLKVSSEGETFVVDVPVDGSVFRIDLQHPCGVWSVTLLDVSEGQSRPLLLSGSPLVFGGVPALSRPTQPAFHAPHVGYSVQIIIPVYRNAALVRTCLQSVFASLAANTASIAITVIDDASPDADLRAWLDELAAAGRITLLRNPDNLGFIETANRGLRQCAGRDALLLNADTVVHGDWVDRLCTALYSAPDIASVTPWSNNGEVSSFPHAACVAPIPSVEQLALMDEAAKALRLDGGIQDVDIPCGCGFALLMRYSVLAEIGLLDGTDLTRGYSEEVDWCLRASAAGYRHRLASGVFVAHAGNASFGYEKTLRVAQNHAVISARYPGFYAHYHAFIKQDPLQHARAALHQKLEQECPHWLGVAMAATKSSEALPQHVPLPLRAACRRIAVWQYDPGSCHAAKILALARLIASQPALSPPVRLLVFGTATEALWRTGVADVLPKVPQKDAGLLSDAVLLGLSGCLVLVCEVLQTVRVALEQVRLDHTFEPRSWFFQWLDREGLPV